MAQARTHDHVYWYLNELTSRVVAKSGISTDRYHIGKIVLQSFKDDPDFVAQIDGGTNVTEVNASLLKRSIQCAISFRNMGLKQGDVMVLMAPNHLDLAVPFYAAMYLGLVIAPIDRLLKVGELEYTFNLYKPSIIFCQSVNTLDVETQNLSAKVVTFDKQNHACLDDFLKADGEEVDNFKAEDFNAEESIAMILPTSGSTGMPKGASITYRTWMITGPHLWARFIKFPSPTRSWLILSPLQWLSAVMHFVVSPFMKYTRLQTSNTVTLDHTRYLINTYKPTCSVLSSTMMVRLLKSGDNGQCDMTCFDAILVGGAQVDKETLELIKENSPETTVINAFGMTELGTIAFQGACPLGSCGKPSGIYQHRLIDLDTQEDIKGPNVNGELWIKGPMFKEYYNNPEATAEAFAKDGWFKTGDMFCRDEDSNYYFVERIKMLLKYKHFQISPSEIESVIRAHPSVIDAAVTGIPDPECGDLPVACIIAKPGCTPNAQEIKDLVKGKLSDAKQLRGGVVFLTSFPLTATSKINRKELNNMVRSMKFE